MGKKNKKKKRRVEGELIEQRERRKENKRDEGKFIYCE